MMQPRQDYHKRCPIDGKQQQTCRHCVNAAFNGCVALGKNDDETFLEVRDVSKSYFCLPCLRRSIDRHAFSQADLVIARSCVAHRESFAIKRCPCGKMWADCLKCMRNGVDPRAGLALCFRCHARRGTRAGSCGCQLPQPGPALPIHHSPSPSSSHDDARDDDYDGLFDESFYAMDQPAAGAGTYAEAIAAGTVTVDPALFAAAATASDWSNGVLQ